MRSPRLIIAALLVVFALMGYWSKRDTNPVTGETQYVALNTKQEIALGLQSAPQMAAQFGGEDPDPAVQEFVREVGNKIVRSSDASRAPYEYRFTVLRDPQTVNAFALPGGPIFITRGLLNLLHNEAQLAGVLGHEIGHVVARHSSEHLAKTQLAQTLAGAAGVAASDEYGRGQQAYMIAAFAAQMAQLRYGRNDELESDRLGVKYMSAAGYNPRAMLGVMKILAGAGKGQRQPEFLSTHPDPGNRQQTITRAIEEQFPGGVPENLTTGREFRKRTGSR